MAWECRCTYGNTVYAISSRLNAGRIKSCGYLRKEYLAGYGPNRKLDLTGERFGHLTVLREIESRQNRAVMLECLCDCGNITVASRDALRSGDKRSCGCLRRKNGTELNILRKK